MGFSQDNLINKRRNRGAGIGVERVLGWVQVVSSRRASDQKPSIGAVRKFVPEFVSGRRARRRLGCTHGHDHDGHHAHHLACDGQIFGSYRLSDGDGGLYDSRS